MGLAICIEITYKYKINEVVIFFLLLLLMDTPKIMPNNRHIITNDKTVFSR